MSDKLTVDTGGDLQSGSLNIYDYCNPPLNPGTWTIITEQTIVWKEKEINQTYSKDQTFEVAGPRFTIDPSDVHAVYPPAGAQGRFDNILPHIVLTKRTLPWERPISGAPDPTNPVPWITLMILEESEIYTAGGTEKAQPQARTVNDLINPPAVDKILGPQGLQNVSSDDLQSPCYTVDIDPAVFADIIPAREELPYLAHCRQVVVTNKEPQGDVYQEDGTGWYSVTVANRLPQAGTKAFCCLVSLEGFEDYLYGAVNAGSVTQYNAVRMAVLAFWNFTALQEETASFAELMINLDACLLKMPKTPAGAGTGSLTEAEQFVTAALSDGYVPMTYETRVGEKTVAWYRGPFSSVILEENTDIQPFFSAESALIYDQTTGMFDASYAVAWQIGRLLALSDSSFSSGMLQWRQQQNQQINTELRLKNTSPEVLALLDIPEDTLELLPPEILQKKLRDVLALKLPGMAVKKGEAETYSILVRDKTGVLNRKGQLPGVLSAQELSEAITAERSFFAAIREKIFTDEKQPK